MKLGTGKKTSITTGNGALWKTPVGGFDKDATGCRFCCEGFRLAFYTTGRAVEAGDGYEFDEDGWQPSGRFASTDDIFCSLHCWGQISGYTDL